MRTLRIGMAQINTIVGDLDGNTRKICDTIERAKAQEVDLVTFPELAVTGYPPEDLLLRPSFIQGNLAALREIAGHTRDIAAVVGYIDRRHDLFNAAAFLHDGEVVDTYHKIFLPNYGVFDEDRYFQSGSRYPVYVFNGIAIGVNICEDIWYPDGPTTVQALDGDAEVIVNINASPYYAGKWRFREKMLATRAADNTVIVTYNNLVGGQDELVFDGYGMILDQNGAVICRGPQFEEAMLIADLDVDAVFRSRLHDPRRRKDKARWAKGNRHAERIVIADRYRPRVRPAAPAPMAGQPRDVEEIYQALVLGTRDYMGKNRFRQAVIGLSGGVDSALTAAIAVDALGAENVIGVLMPSQYTSDASNEDALELARNLGIRATTIPIAGPFAAFGEALQENFKDREVDVAEENVQARIRGTLLMALSNKFGWLVLTTGNKSETSVGYCTLYGDMAGGFAVLKDVYKITVYELCRYRNGRGPTIPERIITKPPSAELRPDQKDSDSLPPYEALDPILRLYVEEDCSVDEIVARGHDAATVLRVIKMVDRAEYKRRQAPPGIKITPRAFGRDRRMPITSGYVEGATPSPTSTRA